MRLKKVALIGIITLLLVSSAVGLDFIRNNYKIANAHAYEALTTIEKNTNIQDYLVQPLSDWRFYKEKVEVKGIFLTGSTVKSDERFNELIQIVNETELNTMVIDVKNDSGQLTYESNIDLAKEIGANNKVIVANFPEKMELLLENEIYPIARIVTFKDKKVGAIRPDLVLKSRNGGVWRDKDGNTWLDPFNKASWEYPIQLAEEAALMGFKEIQFDYVRFPTDGRTYLIDYSHIGEKTKADAIAAFLNHARERLEPLGAYVSADIFGDVINVSSDAGIGQNFEALAVSADILCPMVYPSHYNLGYYGVSYPNSSPYKIVYAAMKKAVERMAEIDIHDKNKAILRPWLQDFSAGYLKNKYGPYFVPYGSEQIKAQIQATYDAGLKEWIFWNSSNIYTVDAFYNTDIDIEQFQRQQQSIINQNIAKLSQQQNNQSNTETENSQEGANEEDQEASSTTENTQENEENKETVETEGSQEDENSTEEINETEGETASSEGTKETQEDSTTTEETDRDNND